MLRRVVEKRRGPGRLATRPADLVHRAIGRAQWHLLELPPGTLPATLRWTAAALGTALVFWYLASYPGALSVAPHTSPAAWQQEQMTPSGCSVLELDRAANRTTHRPCPSRAAALAGI